MELTMTDSNSRRAVLGSIGALTAGAFVSTPATAHDDCGRDSQMDDCEKETRECPKDEKKEKPKKGTEVCTYRCGEPEECTWPEWADGALTIQNCSDCPRKVNFRSSDGVSEDEYKPDSNDINMQVPREGRVTVYFAGAVTALDTEPADMNIGITMRSEHRAHYCK